jgi:hypothetical protein
MIVHTDAGAARIDAGQRFRRAERGIAPGVAEWRNVMTDRDQDVHTDTVTRTEGNAPNEHGYAGGASTPQPEQERDDARAQAEEIAVPGGDLTGGLSEGLTDTTKHDGN